MLASAAPDDATTFGSAGRNGNPLVDVRSEPASFEDFRRGLTLRFPGACAFNKTFRFVSDAPRFDEADSLDVWRGSGDDTALLDCSDGGGCTDSKPACDKTKGVKLGWFVA